MKVGLFVATSIRVADALQLRRCVETLCLVAPLALAGCASAPQQKGAFDPKLAKSVDTAASQAGVAKPGTKVCRWIPLGIAEKDLISGVVEGTEGGNVRVRIDNPGRFPNSLNGHRIAKGEVLSDAAVSWIPCTS